MPTLDRFPEAAVATLRRHDLLLPLLRKQTIAEAVSGIHLPADSQQQLLQAYCQRLQIGSEEALLQHLQQRGLTLDDLTWQLQLPQLVQLHSRKQFLPKAEARFLARKDHLDHVVYSLLRLKDPFLAREFHLRILEAETSFAELAAEHTEGPERALNGLVGPVPLTQAHPAVVQRLRTATPGELLDPFPVGEWWLLLRLERTLPATFDEAMASRMCTELFDEWVEQEATAKLAALCPPLPVPSATR